MVNTSDRPIYVDGVRLDTLAWNIEKVNRSVAGRREANVQVPGRDGVIPSLNDDLETATFGLEMFVMGTDPDGAVPAEGRRDRFRANLDELVHLFGKRHALLEVMEQTGPGAQATNLAVGATDVLAGVTTTGITFLGKSWSRTTGGVRANAPLELLRQGATYTGVWEVANDTASTVNVSVDMADGPVVTAPLAAGATALVTAKHARVWDATFRFTDLSTGGNGSILFRTPTILEGDWTATPVAFDGDTPEDSTHTYRWTGVAGNSTSERLPKARRRAWAKVTDSITPEVDLTGSSGRFTVGMELPYGVWEDVGTQDWEGTPGTASGTHQGVLTLDGATERITDAVILVQGPATNPRVTDPNTGAYVELQAALGAAEQWRVNVGTWSTRTGTLTLASADATGTDRQAVTVFGGTPNQAAFLPLTPVRDAGVRRVRVRLSGTEFTASTNVSVRARRKFAL